MTPDDLAAIRARDAEVRPGAISTLSLEDAISAAFNDRAHLLAEVDRLTGRVAYFEATWADEDMVKHAERARIRAAVEGLPFVPCYRWHEHTDKMPFPTDGIDRAAVLAAIDGEGE